MTYNQFLQKTQSVVKWNDKFFVDCGVTNFKFSPEYPDSYKFGGISGAIGVAKRIIKECRANQNEVKIFKNYGSEEQLEVKYC